MTLTILQPVPPLGAESNKGWMGKTSYFRAKCVNISKAVENASKVTNND